MKFILTNAAPWLTLAILLALSAALPNRSEFNPDTARRQAEVASALSEVSLFVGRWVGVDVPVPPEAQKLLRPNAILSRAYQSTGPAESLSVRVLVVHCGDARDMIGHYPPVCYPSAGWMESPVLAPDQVTLDAGGLAVPVRTYCFRSPREHGGEDVIRIFNAFILPDGTITREIDDINRQSERLAVSVQGVAQLQLITSEDVSLERAVSAANELLGGMAPLLASLCARKGGNHGAS